MHVLRLKMIKLFLNETTSKFLISLKTHTFDQICQLASNIDVEDAQLQPLFFSTIIKQSMCEVFLHALMFRIYKIFQCVKNYNCLEISFSSLSVNGLYETLTRSSNSDKKERMI